MKNNSLLDLIQQASSLMLTPSEQKNVKGGDGPIIVDIIGF